MTEFDLDHLGDLWRAQPDPAEIERLRRSAEAVRRRARWGQLADFWLALVVSGVLLALIISDPQIKTGLIGAVTILYLLYSTVRQRRLRAAELETMTGSTEHMLDQSILLARATTRRAWISLLLMPPGLILGLSFGAMLNRDSDSGLIERLTSNSQIGWAIAIGISIATIVVGVQFVRTRNKAQRELDRLLRLREAFHTESAEQ